ncbi:aminoglycoside 6-adenylyltransferase [Paenibacillus chartarius]|uniref:Aminoglycoside 6-adenylyltransferase n=1 Tax=Paenibacillus chartarius TaxID=747481 RepID=A0ABV6DQU1_9BACL
MRNEREVLSLLLDFAREDDSVRAVLLNGSRVNPNLTHDRFTDYDVIFAVTDPSRFLLDQSWIRRFGELIMMQQNIIDELTRPWPIFLMLFEDGVRIDLSYRYADAIDSYLDDSLTKVLLDKDGAIPVLPEPSDSSYVTRRPSRSEYDKTINEIWWCLTNAAKGLCRQELPYAKFMLDTVVRDALVRLLSWHIGSRADWQVNVGKAGRWLRQYLPEELWQVYVATYADADTKHNWAAIMEVGKLTRAAGKELGKRLGYEYPLTDDMKVTAYLRQLMLTEGS